MIGRLNLNSFRPELQRHYFSKAHRCAPAHETGSGRNENGYKILFQQLINSHGNETDPAKRKNYAQAALNVLNKMSSADQLEFSAYKELLQKDL